MNLRNEFDIIHSYTYLNTAATSPLPRYVISAMDKYLKSRAECAECAWDVWMEQVLKAREVCGSFIGASRGEVAFLKNTGEGLNTACSMIGGKGNIVTTDSEFPSNYLPWKRGYKDLRVVAAGDGGYDPSDFEKAIDDDTAAVTFSEITYDRGCRLPTREIAEVAHDHGAIVVSDAVQALGAVRMDVKDMGIDIMCCGGHKWLASPFGVGIFYVSSEMQERFDPPYLGWMSLEDSDDFSLENTLLAKSARKYEIGNLNLSGIFGLMASIEMMTDYGTGRIEDEVEVLSSYLIDRLQERGINVATPRDARGGIVAAEIAGAQDVVESLLKKRIVVACRRCVRISPHFWNTKSDLDTLLDAL